MAASSFLMTQPLMTTTSISKTSLCPFYQNKYSQTPGSAKRKSKALSRRSSIPCMAMEEGRHDDQQNTTTNSINQRGPQAGKLDRRNVLLGLGGLYGVSGLRPDTLTATAKPVLPPDISKCRRHPTDLPLGVDTYCCPPASGTIIDYKPGDRTCVRVRPAAHKLSGEYIAKYNKAMELMRGLPCTDPRSFMQQANVHCAYCNGAYGQAGALDDGIDLQVHFNWLFFPFHRWYLYFYERILGKLIGDPSFALPFWNWDHPDGMQMPAIFTDKSSALYDEKRSNEHQPPAIIDLNYHQDKTPRTYDKQVQENLSVMYTSMVSGAKKPLLFFGPEYRRDSEKPTFDAAGTVERVPHTAVHVWSGSEKSREPHGEDMGNFYSAGRDPMFYSLHANVDRLWNVWKEDVRPGRNKDIKDPDYLETAFLFYDENAQLVRVKVRDCLDSKALGYVYEKVDLPWLHKRPILNPVTLPKPIEALAVGAARAAVGGKRVALADFPITLTDSPVTTVVPRPKKGRSKEEKEEEEEVLVVEDVAFDPQLAMKFDVYVNDEDVPGPDYAQFAGSFGNVPHKVRAAGQRKASMNLGITDLLDDIGADNDDEILVTLVPKTKYPITIGGIKIDFIS